jgi:YidC/Oxa1 family membrane protein insertase
MDRNFLLVIALSLVVWVVWGSLVKPPPPPPEAEKPAAEAAAGEEQPAPSEPAAAPGELPKLEVKSPEGGAGVEAPAQPETQPAVAGRIIAYETPLVRMELDTRGAGIRHLELTHFDTGPNAGHRPIVLSTGQPPFDRLLVTPLDELGLGDLSNEVFDLVDQGGGHFEFLLERDGIAVRKAYTFAQDSYAFELRVQVDNGSSKSVAPHFALTWPAAAVEGQDFRQQSLSALYKGKVKSKLLSSLGKRGLFGGGEREERFAHEVDWAGMRTTYFVGAMLPDDPAQANARFVATTPGEAGVAQVYFDPVSLPPGQSAERLFRVYAGPKEPERLEAVGSGLIKSIDLGYFWMTPLTRFFLWLLSVLHTFVPNYGFAIILLTVLVRGVTTPLTTKQMRSMERMRALNPKLQELKETYADDRQKQSEEMMRLYRQEGVNPLGGCFPMLLQLPVFIGLFYALRSSIQLRQAPFIGWINDLSAPETLFIIPGTELPFRLLPLVMGATMLLQQKITPMQQMDPAQQRMMVVMMPLMMTAISYTFPSGLVLYWMVSNVLAITHQLWIGRGLRAQPQPA